MWIQFAIFLLVTKASARDVTRFTNVECVMLVPSYASFEQCELKILGRGIIGLNIYAKLKQGPFNNAKVNIGLWRKFNGYRPFIFNTTFDFCKFMERQNQKLSYEKIFMGFMLEASNMNHTCPYEEAVIVKNMVFKDEFLKFAPLPAGQYKFQLMAATNREWKTIVNVYFSFAG